MMPEKENIIKDLKYLTALPHRRTGTEENDRSAQYISDRFSENGLSDVRINHYLTKTHTYSNWQLKADDTEIPAFYINGSLMKGEEGTFTDNPSGQLVYVGKGLKEDLKNIDVKGKIVMADVLWRDYTLNSFKNEHACGECWFYDPDNTIDDVNAPIHKDTYTPCTFPFNYAEAMAAGAAGFIGILEDNCDRYIHINEDYNFLLEMGLMSSFGYDPPSEDKMMKLPGLWISRSTGEKLKRKLEEASVMASISLTNRIGSSQSNVVSGILPGKSDEIILIHSHHDSVWKGGVQDGAAMSCVLAVMDYWAKMPVSDREKSFMFAATDTHYTDYEGHMGFINDCAARGLKIIADISAEHIGKEAVQNAEGQFELTGNTGLKLIYTTENRKLLQIVQDAVKTADVRRSLVVPVNSEQGYVCSDSAVFFSEGIPVVSLISPLIYLMDPVDTIEMVDEEALVPVANYMIAVSEVLQNLNAEELAEEKFTDYFCSTLNTPEVAE